VTTAGGRLPNATFDIGAAGRGYGVDVVDYGDHRGGGLLIHNGTGLALAVMDSVPELRWVVDWSGLVLPVPGRMRWFLDCASQMSTLTVAALVFFGDDPAAAREALHHVTGPLVWIGSHELVPSGRAARALDFPELVELSEKARVSACSRLGNPEGYEDMQKPLP
jgi:hypothetical protein